MRKLTDDEVRSYHDNGFLKLESYIPVDVVQDAIAALDKMLDVEDLATVAELEPNHPRIVRRIWSPVEKNDVFRQIAEHPTLVDAVEQLIGRNIVLHYSKINMKAPNYGSPAEWHQDMAYYPHTNGALVSCLIYLDDADEGNSCLAVLPRSHRHGILDHFVGDFFRGKIKREKIERLASDAVALGGPAGTTIFLGPLTVHCSSRNTSDRYRRAFLPAYRAADSFPIYYGKHVVKDEAGARLLRGTASHSARLEAGVLLLPIAEALFNSLYEVQER